MDVHVYESAPPSPRRKPLALMSPSADDGPTISLGEWKGRGKEILLGNTGEPPHPTEQTSLKQSPKEVAQPNDGLFAEEGTPEDIRRRFFPALPSDQPSLAWIQGPDSQSDNLATNPALRFDLSGTPIPAALISTLPTHLGLHHHADGTHAGYTLDDIFLLSRSTVPAQRASMLDILGKIARKLAQSANKTGSGIPELHGQEAELRKRILASGVELMAEKGSVGVRAVEAIWVCIVYWESNLLDVEGVELRSKSDDILASLPLDYILTQMTESFQTAVHPPESLQQLLAILQHLAQASNDVASTIVSTPKLVANLMSRFLLTPMPPSHETEYPDPLALRVLINLVSGSQINAKALVQPAETLLRFVVILPTSSPFIWLGCSPGHNRIRISK
ncbi:hypothetical protein EW026_g5052 [Hermanssonia centrifuga]|uniref:RPAP1 C-terminal domain-containing protein n=1 Tax=Hermanssonia centrifuga TaxID=98765 RepID=A0A4S4KFB1_9APHY|nr:hypothetical protein EW026_g5052 [Hermanssonia centrifuga]